MYKFIACYNDMHIARSRNKFWETNLTKNGRLRLNMAEKWEISGDLDQIWETKSLLNSCRSNSVHAQT